ncbi:type II toxin-antitoxin system prevent-host-death family antitoxin [Streptomyces sp. NPDC048479]
MLITDHGQPAAVLISVQELASLEATLAAISGGKDLTGPPAT